MSTEEPGTAADGPLADDRRLATMQLNLQSFFAVVSELFRGGKAVLPKPLGRRGDGSPTTNVTVIGLVINHEDRRLIAGVGSRNQWNVVFVDTCEEARAALDQVKVPVILCDRDLPGKEWRNVVQVLASSPRRACIILISKVVDEYLWDEMVGRGGYDVLPKPLREEDVVRAVRLAWSYWKTATEAPPPPAKRA
jgi:CheY-like chemotaxis protein